MATNGCHVGKQLLGTTGGMGTGDMLKRSHPSRKFLGLRLGEEGVELEEREQLQHLVPPPEGRTCGRLQTSQLSGCSTGRASSHPRAASSCGRHCRNAKNIFCMCHVHFLPSSSGHADRNVRVRSWVKCHFLHCGHLGSPERVFFGGLLAAAFFPRGCLPLAAGFSPEPSPCLRRPKTIVIHMHTCTHTHIYIYR